MNVEQRFKALSDAALASLGELLLSDDPAGPLAAAPRFSAWLVDEIAVEQGRRDGRPCEGAGVDLSDTDLGAAVVVAAHLQAAYAENFDVVARESGLRPTLKDRAVIAELGSFAAELTASLFAYARLSRGIEIAVTEESTEAPTAH